MTTTINTLVARLEALWQLPRDERLAAGFGPIDAVCDELRTLDAASVKAIAKAFGCRGESKTQQIDRVYHKLAERLARCLRGEIIAQAARVA